MDRDDQSRKNKRWCALEDYKLTANYRIETEARAYMDKAVTPVGKRVSVYDCLMALFTMVYSNLPDDNPEKQLRQSQGLFLQQNVISGMIDTIAYINYGVYQAKQAIATSSGTIQIDNIKFEQYI